MSRAQDEWVKRNLGLDPQSYVTTDPDPDTDGTAPTQGSPVGLKPVDPNVLPDPGPDKPATDANTRQHVHDGGTVNDPQSPYNGKWDGTGIHDWNGMQKAAARDGYNIKSVKEDPSTGTRRVEIERVGKELKTGKEVRGVVKKTLYPKTMTEAQIDAAGEQAFQSARQAAPGSKIDVPGTKLKSNGSPADGYFEATVPAGNPPVQLRIQGWYKIGADGTPSITSHTPAYNNAWPTINPSTY